jgi:hypothetical protein
VQFGAAQPNADSDTVTKVEWDFVAVYSCEDSGGIAPHFPASIGIAQLSKCGGAVGVGAPPKNLRVAGRRQPSTRGAVSGNGLRSGPLSVFPDTVLYRCGNANCRICAGRPCQLRQPVQIKQFGLFIPCVLVKRPMGISLLQRLRRFPCKA